MKNSVKWIVIALLLVGILAGAMALYNKYGNEYLNQGDGQLTNSATESTADAQGSPSAEENTTESIKNPALDFSVTDENGNTVKLSDYKGKPVVVNFWATWCYYCKVEMPDFNEAYKEYPDVQFLMVNATDGQGETVDVAKSYVEQEGYEFNVFFDTVNRDAVRTYNVTSYPQTLFIDKDGNIISQRIGMLSKDILVQEIEKITE